MLDVQSPLAIKIVDANPHAYETLVIQDGTPELAREQLEDVQPEQLLTAPVKSPVAAYAMLAGLWLWHDGLSECHEIVQKSPEDLLMAALNLHRKPLKASPKVPFGQFVEIDKTINPPYLHEMTSTLAFWHAIMHRREGDFSNSKYWYARAGRHPILDSLGAHAAQALNPLPADKGLLRVLRDGWDAEAFVDLVQELHAQPDDARLPAARALQQIEWRLLFEHCARAATSS